MLLVPREKERNGSHVLYLRSTPILLLFLPTIEPIYKTNFGTMQTTNLCVLPRLLSWTIEVLLLRVVSSSITNV